MKVTILIANYNNGKYFKDCYDGLIAQEYPHWEVLILDDCSTDNSVEVIEKLIQGDNRFRLIKEKVNRGVGYAKSTLAKTANSEILAFLDPDDVITPRAIGNLIRGFKEHEDAVGIYCMYFITDVNLVPIREAQPMGGPVIEPYQYWERGFGAIHAFCGFRKAAYDKTIGINPAYRMGEDIDLYLKLEEHGPFYRSDEPVYLYRQNNGSLTKSDTPAATWIWVLGVYMQNGRRRVQEHKMSQSKYAKLILEKLLFCLREAKTAKDDKTFSRLMRDFRSFPFNRQLLLSPVFYKYVARHFREFIY